MNSNLLLIFDCDGVLIDSEPLANRIFIQCLRREGFDVDELYGEGFYGIALKDCLAKIEQDFSRGVSPRFEEVLAREIHAEMETALKPVEGIIAALEKLPYPKCVASGSDHERLQLSLSITGILPFFKHIYSATDVANGKPAPDVFLHAAAQMGFAPSQCIVIEDSYPGVQAGVAAGMKVLLYDPIWTDKHAVPDGVTIFYNMQELPALVQNFCATIVQ